MREAIARINKLLKAYKKTTQLKYQCADACIGNHGMIQTSLDAFAVIVKSVLEQEAHEHTGGGVVRGRGQVP
jgi:hypothetical protein